MGFGSITLKELELYEKGIKSTDKNYVLCRHTINGLFRKAYLV